MYQEGDKIICKVTGKQGHIIHMYPLGATVSLNGYTAVRSYSDLMPAKVEATTQETVCESQMSRDELIALQHLAVETGDYEWFKSLGERLGALVSG